MLFDVDGTLYHQAMLRVCMCAELAALPVAERSIVGARRTYRAIRAYRRAQEVIRGRPPGDAPIAELQLEEASRHAREHPTDVARTAEEWFVRRPLKYLRFCRRQGLLALLAQLDARGVRVGVISDYPVEEKLRALELAGRFSVAICTSDPRVNAFKPHPRGFRHACATWGLKPEEVLYVGDRPEVDATGAAAAGMGCAILSRQPAGRLAWSGEVDYLAVNGFGHLRRIIEPRL